jgi:hypothetical protein
MNKNYLKFVAGSALFTAAGVASATDVGTTITSAFSAGQANLGLAAAGVITMVAVLTGIGLIVSMLRK